MNTFVVVATRSGASRPTPPGDRIRATPLASLVATGVLARHPDATHHWESDDRRVAVSAWETAPEALGVGSRWATADGGVTTFTGLPWRDDGAWSTERSWAAQISDLVSSGPSASQGSRRPPTFDGIYGLARVDRHGEGFVTADPLGYAVLYHGQTADHLVVSNRAAVVAWLVTPPGQRPEADTETAGALAFISVPLDDRTGFAAVRCLPQDGHVQIGANGASIDVPPTKPWLSGPPAIDLEDALDSIGSRIRRGLRRVVELPTATPVFELTGGKDSRLLLAHALAEGIADEFTYLTWGPPDHPDVQISEAVLAHLGLPRNAPPRADHPLSAGQPAPERAEDARTAFAADLRHHLMSTSGATSTWDMRPTGSVSPRPSVCGVMGETLRGTQLHTGWFTSMRQLEAYVRLDGFATDPARLLRPEARRHYQDRMIAAFRAALPEGGTPQDAVHGYYLGVRLRRWFGAYNEHEHRNRAYPLYSLEAIRTAFAIGSARRLAGVLPYELMRRAAPDLVGLPFEGTGWPATLGSHCSTNGLPLAAATTDRQMHATVTAAALALRGGVPVAALQAASAASRRVRGLARGAAGSSKGGTPTASSGTIVELKQITELDAKVAVLREQLDVGPSHPLHDVIDVDAARSRLDQFATLDYSQRRGVHDAATALAWTSDAYGPEPTPMP